MSINAIILTDGLLNSAYAKTAHGLITGLSRYPISGVIDPVHKGADAGVIVDGKPRSLPVFASIPEAVNKLVPKPTHCIIGLATHGGYITASLEATIKTAIENRLCVVNGLHELVSEHPQLKPVIEKYKTEIIDIRKPKTFRELHMWNGSIQKITIPRIAVLGMDCAIGKRTTCQLIYQQCQKDKIRAEMIYTGQTGWLQGFRYGFIFDSTLNDFVAGELEHAIVSCAETLSPELILLEGQSALRNPSGPCGAELICSAQAKGVILQHVPGRKYFSHGEGVDVPLPPLKDELDLIKLYGASVLAITLNTKDLGQEPWHKAKSRVEEETGLPVICPREEGVAALMPVIKNFMRTIYEN